MNGVGAPDVGNTSYRLANKLDLRSSTRRKSVERLPATVGDETTRSAVGVHDFFKGWLHVVKQRFNAPGGYLRIAVARSDDRGEKFHRQVVRFRESAAIEHKQSGFPVNGCGRFRKLLEIRERLPCIQHAQLLVAFK